MRILWFTLTPSMAESVISGTTEHGGWIKSLESAIVRSDLNIELAVAFHSNKSLEPFNLNKTKYYPIRSIYQSKIKRVFYKLFFAKIDVKSALPKYLSIVHDFKPDLIHIHGTEKSFGTIIPEVNIPVVISLQGILSVYTYKYFAGIPASIVKNRQHLIMRLKGDDYLMHFKRFRNRSIIEREVLKNVQFIFGRTDWDKRVSSVLAPKAVYFHIDEVIRESFYTNIWNKKTADGEFSMITILKNTLYKGFETLLDAAKLLVHIGFNFKWYVIGINKSAPIAILFAHEIADLDNRIILQGPAKEEELAAKMLEADLYVQTSHIENSPNSVAEAMLLGMPILATFAGGTSTLLTDKEEGALIQDGDPWSMAGAILEIQTNYNKAVKAGKNARKKALQRHDPARIVESLIAAYKTIKET